MIYLGSLRATSLASSEFIPCSENKEKGFYNWLRAGWLAIQKGKDTDKVIVVCGGERKGKTTITLRITHSLDKNFNVDNITFNSRGFRISSKKVKRNILILDEGGNALYSGDSMTTETKLLVKRIMEMGSNNNLTFILIPDFFSLHKNIRERRVGGLIRVMSKGKFFTYSEAKAQKIGKAKAWCCLPTTKGYWNHTNQTAEFRALWRAYKKKEDKFKNRPLEDEQEESPIIDKATLEKQLLKETANKLYSSGNLSQKDIAKSLGVTPRTVRNWIKSLKVKGKDLNINV